MTTPDTKPMQGLDDYLRAQASVIGMQGMHSAAETLRQWASEVEAAAQAPVVPIVDKAFDEQTLWAGYVSQNHFGATGEGGLFHFKRGAGFARRMLSTPASETAPSVQPEPLTPKAFAELCDLAREINNRPNSNCPVKCESMEQCSGACDFVEQVAEAVSLKGAVPLSEEQITAIRNAIEFMGDVHEGEWHGDGTERDKAIAGLRKVIATPGTGQDGENHG